MADTTGKRRLFKPSERLVSTTNKGGRIVFANQDFINISGYSREELEGSPHNIVRHPDMPKAVFENLWATIKQGRPWVGMVKNRVKNGDHYWVDAHITPVIEKGQLQGFQSVRVAPDEAAVKRAESCYRRMRNGGRTGGAPALSWTARLFGTQLAALLLLAVLAVSPLSGPALWVAVLAVLAAGTGTSMGLCRQWRPVLEQCRAVYSDDLARQIYTGRRDEIGDVALALKVLRSQKNTILTRVAQSTGDLESLAGQAADAVRTTDTAIHNQQSELGSVSSAVTQMSSAIVEVSSNTAKTSTAAEEADRNVTDGHRSIEASLSATSQLANYIDEVTQLIRRLGEDGDAIGSVIDVINGIAEQTNLLALNAAIEAARAGEQGRGFAVVADEVRTLAQRTQDSTIQIKDIISRIQDSTRECVGSMETAQDKAQHCVSHNQHAGSSYSLISESVSEIRNMAIQVAAAVEEQSAVAEEVNHNIVSIQNQSEETARASQLTARTSDSLAEHIQRTREMIEQFSV